MDHQHCFSGPKAPRFEDRRCCAMKQLVSKVADVTAIEPEQRAQPLQPVFLSFAAVADPFRHKLPECFRDLGFDAHHSQLITDAKHR